MMTKASAKQSQRRQLASKGGCTHLLVRVQLDWISVSQARVKVRPLPADINDIERWQARHVLVDLGIVGVRKGEGGVNLSVKHTAHRKTQGNSRNGS